MSPPKNTVFGLRTSAAVVVVEAGRTSTTVQDAQSVCQRSKSERFATCCAGVHAIVNDAFAGAPAPDAEAGSATETVESSHQSRVWMCEVGMPKDARCGVFPRGAKKCGRDFFQTARSVASSMLQAC